MGEKNSFLDYLWIHVASFLLYNWFFKNSVNIIHNLKKNILYFSATNFVWFSS